MRDCANFDMRNLLVFLIYNIIIVMKRLFYLSDKIKNNFMRKFNLPDFEFLKNFKNKKSLFAVVLAAIAAGLVIPGGNAHAAVLESLGGAVLDLVAPLIYLVFYIFFYIAYIVAWIGASMIDMALNPAIINSVLDMSPTMPLYQAWTIFRDVANLLFILILLLIALGTIFRAESYNIKKSLYKFILIIFLINFSGMIAGLFIDFGNFLMYGVLKMMCVAGNAKCFQDFYAQLMGVIDILWKKYSITGISFDFKDAAAIGIAAIYTFIYGLVLMVLGVFLLIRIAALAILIILSPLAFFGYTAPGLEGFKNQWWDNLVKYVMFGPVFALMLYVSGLMAQNALAVDPAIFEVNKNLSWMAQDITMILTSIIPLIFLIGIIPVTRAFGIAGSDAILGGTTGLAAFAGGFLGSATDRWLARGAGMKGSEQKGWKGGLSRAHAWTRRRLSNVSPGSWKRAYKAQKADEEHDYDVATGAMRNKMDPYGAIKDKYGKWKDQNYKSTKRDYEKEVKIRKGNEEWKSEGVDNANDAIDSIERGKKMGESVEKLSVKVKFIAAEDGIDDMLERSADRSGVKYGMGAAGLKKYIDETFGNLSEEEKSKLFSSISKLEVKNGNSAYEGLGDSYFDATRKQTVYTVNPLTTGINPRTGRTYIQDQEDAQVKVANKKDPKDLKKSSFIDNTGITNAGERIFADMKGTRARRIGMMDRDRVEALDAALTRKYPPMVGMTAIASLRMSNPELADAWNKLKTQHNLP